MVGSSTTEQTSFPDSFVNRLGRAIHAAKRVGGPWGPACGYPLDLNDPNTPWVLIEYDTDPMGTYDCLCKSMAHHLIEIMEYQDSDYV